MDETMDYRKKTAKEMGDIAWRIRYEIPEFNWGSIVELEKDPEKIFIAVMRRIEQEAFKGICGIRVINTSKKNKEFLDFEYKIIRNPYNFALIEGGRGGFLIIWQCSDDDPNLQD